VTHNAPDRKNRAVSFRRTPWTSSAPLALALATALWCQTGRAQPSPSDQAIAQSLFEQGRRQLAEGKTSEACASFAESQRLDPGGGTLLNLALCHEKLGKTASAWAELHEALTQARKEGRSDREKLARAHIDGLEPRLSTLTVLVPPSVRVEGLVVKLDGVAIGPGAWSVPVKVDPGEHAIAIEAPGKQTWARRVRVADGADHPTIEVGPLEDATAPPGPAASGAASAVPARSAGPPPPAPRPEEPSDSRAAWGWTAAGIGVVALGLGAWSGTRALSKWGERKDHCPNEACDAAGVELGDDAHRAAWGANVGVGLGLVGVGIGAYLLLVPRAAPSEPAGAALGPRSGVRVLGSLARDRAGLSLGASW
jgi:hypothetical protein